MRGYGGSTLGNLGQPVQVGQQPGQFVLPTGQEINLVDWRNGSVYDRVSLGTAITAGQEFVYFRDIQNKNYVDTNLTTPNRLPNDWEQIVWKIGVTIDQDVVNADMLLLMRGGYLEFKIAQTMYAQGPIWMFPSGFGIYGAYATTATATTLQANANGAPSPAGVPRLDIPLYITKNVDFQGIIKYYSAETLSAATLVYMVLDGWIKRPVR